VPSPSKLSPTDEMWDLDRMAGFYGVSRSTIRRMCRDGVLPTVKVRGSVRVPRSAVLAHAAGQLNGGAA
jgi:excisionase family DNA binding protein